MLRLLWSINDRLAEVREIDRALGRAVAHAADHFGALEYAILVVPSGSRPAQARVLATGPRFDLEALRTFAGGGRHPDQPDLVAARLRRRGRLWGAVALRLRSQRPWVDRRILTRVAALIDRVVERIDRERERDVRARIDRKIRDRARPHDLFYHILDGIRSLTHYDHSAAIFLADQSCGDLVIIAEQIAWQNIGKSTRIGARIPLDSVFPAFNGHVTASDAAWAYVRHPTGWSPLPRTRGDRHTPDLDAMNQHALASPSIGAPEAQAIAAGIDMGGGSLCIMRASTVRPGGFGTYEADILASFIPQIKAAIHSQIRDAALVRTERQNAIAELARGVAHDISNALGAALPLVQVVRRELADRSGDPATHAQDLEQVERSIRLSREIFDQMLHFAKRADARTTSARVAQVLDEVLLVLAPTLERARVAVQRQIDADLPAVAMPSIDLAQVMLNLVTNARDAMPKGGRLTISARRSAADVTITLEDTGPGVPSNLRSRVFEPFFTTKASGTGLGLAICRSIVWEAKGTISIGESAEGGASVLLTLPAASLS